MATVSLAAVLVPVSSAAEPRMWRSVQVAGGTDGLAAAARLPAGLPAWRVFYESVRRRHPLWGEGPTIAVDPPAKASADGAVPLPLAPDVWRRVTGKDGVPDDRLAAAILGDRGASLLYRGLASLDEPTLRALAEDLPTLRRIYEGHAVAFAAFGSFFRVKDGAVALPGGAEAAVPWESLVGASRGAPALFLERLLSANGGRRAFLFDSVARLDPDRQRFALGMGAKPGGAEGEGLRRLAAVFDQEAAWWRYQGGTFARPEVDAARVLREVRLGADGALAPPAARAFWHAVFGGWVPADRDGWPAVVRLSSPADAAWLVEQAGVGDPALRRLRLEQVAFAQRVFARAGDDALPDVLLAVQGLKDARAAVLSLERMGSSDPTLYAAASRAARAAAAASPSRPRERWLAQGGLQGALALIDRARVARTLELAAAEGLARSLFALPVGEAGARERALASWMDGVLLPELARAVYGTLPAGDPETTVLRAMAGDRVEGRDTLVPFDWEGLWYHADPGRAELARLERVRERQGGPGLAAALRACASPVADAGAECGLGEALIAIAYAAHAGEADGPALAGEDPSRRHDFGPEPWALPVEISGPGIPWHVRGSLLGLERALARLSLHRLAGDALPDGPPTVNATQRRSLAVLAVVSSPGERTDEGRDAVTGALEAGRFRVAALRAGDPAVDSVAAEAGLEPWRARALEWLLAHEPGARASFFSRVELLHLGGAGAHWREWGAADTLGSGLLARMPPARPLDDSAGRPPEPVLEEVFADLGLRVAEFLGERRLPASLAPALVGTLLPDLFAEARPVALDDRLGLDAWVRDLSRDRLDDAFASLAGRGPLQPAPAPEGAR